MNDAIVKARVSPEIKAAAMANAKTLGFDLSTVIRLVVRQLAATGKIPEGLINPNQETLQAIKEFELGVGVHRVNSVDELKKDLGW
ncbi:type II toxin-antitoxin system RelB/DinJ family antitoxin [Jinshanibacter sp. LJY008]|uniref:Type II toxin-antitoxin system RelB/DinJ family antitoxin n=1 Tax=Limnobaculum eriocheiris TaxID=2897391 RepID=A0A9X1SPM4_9GAMM|nr:type II toxin-antitoxin system RelB/DinJ family antitoxin [Limnobaculum eriocheiris]MCD1126202.1 type II toxin-antitoxin system RelB/DinJ family antitoxin [Limnobaculum eriocheiris]